MKDQHLKSILNQIYDSNHSFYKYHDIKKFRDLSQEKEKKQICLIQIQNYIINC